MFSIIIRAVVMIFLGLAPASFALAARTEIAMPRVVILTSSDSQLPAFIVLNRTLSPAVSY